MQLQWEFIEAKLLAMGYTRETIIAAAQAYEYERRGEVPPMAHERGDRQAAESHSMLNADLANDMSVKQSRAGGA